jgi:hypothetical protein
VPADIFSIRTFTRLAVTVPPSRWQELCQREKLSPQLVPEAWSLKNIYLSERAGKVHMYFLALSLRQALLATVMIDALRGSRYRLCKLARCSIPFEVTEQKRKRFCCEEHRQAYAMQRYRKRLRKKSKSKGR